MGLAGGVVVAAQPGITTIAAPAANASLGAPDPTPQAIGNVFIAAPAASMAVSGYAPDVVFDFYAIPYRDAWFDIPLDSVISGRGRIRGATVTITWTGEPGSPWTGQVQSDQTWGIPVRLVNCVRAPPGGPALFVFQETGVPAQQAYLATGSGDRPLVAPAADVSAGAATPTVAVI